LGVKCRIEGKVFVHGLNIMLKCCRSIARLLNLRDASVRRVRADKGPGVF